ncbi:hypothetical protein GC093_18495 [Paenibacillus sp. LMG 31456]|uniref:Uncharacterized protein n=1 Tax=Paenibacillus foliorum TaxID=2654974 RepID=A0A972K0Z9_9BACL|nr:hypothetical protein [Paenibacillus foliorum]NOU95196.1 hypothetical protein [Paenibacillus foliorum]
MPRLEYRLYGEDSGFPLLYYYDSVEREEIALRFACDYLVKESEVYEKTSNAVEEACYVIYVKRADDERVMSWKKPDSGRTSGLRMELREYRELGANYRLVHTYNFQDNLAAMLHLEANFLYVDGQEWYRTSTEIDEDRETFVFYAVKSESDPAL